jgi:hypothetical protein
MYALPKGFSEAHSSADWLILTYKGCYASVHWKERFWRLGWCLYQPSSNDIEAGRGAIAEQYAGRGWREALFNDAVAGLQHHADA